MLSKKELLLNLKKDLKKLDAKVNHPHLYNGKIRVKKFLLGTGMSLVLCIPTIIGVTATHYTTQAINMIPFKTDLVTIEESVGTITTSNGYYMEEKILGYDTSIENSLISSTAWQQNAEGNYERYETTYNFANLDLSDPESIFKMSEEELKELVEITNQAKITKNKLTEDDEIYNEDVIVITYSYKDKNTKGEIVENEDRKVLTILLTLLILAGYVALTKKVAKFILKKLPSERIKEKKDSYIYITEKEIEELKELYLTKKANYDLLTKKTIDGPTLKMIK